jgi:CSLREA domain-containing protein
LDSHSRRLSPRMLLVIVATAALSLVFATASQAAIYNVNTADDDSPSDSGACTGADTDCSLREAIVAANASGTSDTINVDALDIVLAHGVLTVANDGALTIAGAGRASTSVDGDGASRIILMDSGANLTLNDLTLENGNAGGSGGAIIADGTLSLTRAAIRDSAAENHGGGIFNEGDLTVTDSEITGNFAQSNGGGIYNAIGSTTTVTRSTVDANSNFSEGGGIYSQGQLTVTDSSVTNNGFRDVKGITAETNTGGGISSDSATIFGEATEAVNLRVTGSDISGNWAQGEGGGIAAGGGSTVESTTLRDNISDSNDGGFGPGGAIYNDGDFQLTGSTVEANRSMEDVGGGIANERNSRLTLTTSTVRNNQSQAAGAGIVNGGELIVDRSTISGNGDGDPDVDTPEVGGGIANLSGGIGSDRAGGGNSGATIDIVNSTISGNTAGEGGGVFNGSGNVEAPAGFDPPASSAFLNVTVAGNRATGFVKEEERFGVEDGGEGGGIYNEEPRAPVGSVPAPGDTTLKNTLLDGNTGEAGAANCGGAQPADEGNNLEDGSACGFPAERSARDAVIGALAANGGPTETHALLDGSPALDTADNAACPGTDQREVGRPQGPVCDVGAYEREVAPSAAPPSTPPAAPTRIARPRVRVAGVRSRCARTSVRVRIRVSTAGTIRSVRVTLDGRRLRTTTRRNTVLRVNVRRLRAGRHTLRIVATDTAGNRTTTTRRIVRCAQQRRRAAPRFTG